MLKEALWFAALDPEKRKSIKDEIERKNQFVMPTKNQLSLNAGGSGLRELAVSAPERISERRTRTIPVGLGEIKTLTRLFGQRFANSDGEMLCRICRDRLPFRLNDGLYYFEKEQFIPGLRQLHYQNYLALCPNHGAMFRFALETPESDLFDFNRENIHARCAHKTGAGNGDFIFHKDAPLPM